MKKLLLSGVSLVILASAANAADLQLKAPYLPPPPTWTGAYFGATVGASGHNTSLDLFDIWYDQGYEDYYNGPQRNSSFGFGAGAFAGYNWQAGNFVYGVEADISWHSNRTSQSFMNVDSYEFAVLESKMNAFASFRGRLGYAVGNTMAYVTGGAATAHTTNTYNVGTKPIFFERQKWDWGWVAGGGFEHLVGGHMLVRAEVLYADFDGGRVFGIPYDSPNTTFGVKDQNVVIARIGAGVKF